MIIPHSPLDVNLAICKPSHKHCWQPLFMPPITPEQKRDFYFAADKPRMELCFRCDCGALGAYRGKTRRQIVTITNTRLLSQLLSRADRWNAAMSEASVPLAYQQKGGLK